MDHESLVYALIFLIITALSFLFLRRSHRSKEAPQKAKLPPGSMGWPYIGETLQLYSQDPNVFLASKQKRSNPPLLLLNYILSLLLFYDL